MRFAIVTLFPDMFSALTEWGVIGRAFQQSLATVQYFNPRDYTEDAHRTVDDRPYGGGPGMVMKAEPVALAIAAAQAVLPAAPVCYLSPKGQKLSQGLVVEMSATHAEWILLCGRYEGIDQRVIDHYVDCEISIGDYVVSGGEMPAMVLMDALLRLQPEVLGSADSAAQDSFSIPGQLDCPHYTRPEVWRDLAVPDVLRSGDHRAIAEWRQQQANQQTAERQDNLQKKLLD